MSYLTAIGCVLAIIALVIVGGLIIAYLAKVIINIFDADRKLDKKVDKEEKANVYKEEYVAENLYSNKNEARAEKEISNKGLEDDDDYSYASDVNSVMAKREKEALKKEITETPSDDFFADYKKSLKEEDDDLDEDYDLMKMIDDISDDVINDSNKKDEEKAKEDSAKNASILDKYSIDNIDNFDEEEEEVEERVSENETPNESLEEMRSIRADIMTMLSEIRGEKETDSETQVEEEVAKRVDEKLNENLEVINELKEALAKKEEEIQSAKDSQKELEEKYSTINKQMVEQFASQNREIENQITSTMSQSMDQINALKAQLSELSEQLQEERARNWKVVESKNEVPEKPKDIKVVENNVVESKHEDAVAPEIISDVKEELYETRAEEQISETLEEVQKLTKKVEEITTTTINNVVETEIHLQYSKEDQYLNRIAVLEERLRLAKKDLKVNDKEYKPLEKVKRTLDRDKAKLRRKEAIAAKKKVALYGVNNYVDIDKEKAEKLAHELELLDGLRLSVSHCEEVMNSNKERYPILEHTHIILTNNIKDLEADLEQLNKELKILRDKNEG